MCENTALFKRLSKLLDIPFDDNYLFKNVTVSF